MSKNPKEHWDAIYQAKQSQEVSWYQEKPATSLRLIAELGLPENARIIDVGGGDSTLVDNLLALGFGNITVLDVSSAALERAKERLGNKADAVKWVVSDVGEIVAEETKAGERFDLWHDRAALHFLTGKDDTRKYVEKVKQLLKSSGYVIVSAFSEKGPTKCSGLDIKQYSEDSIKSLFSDFEHIKSFEEEHMTPRGTSQIFIYSVFRK